MTSTALVGNRWGADDETPMAYDMGSLVDIVEDNLQLRRPATLSYWRYSLFAAGLRGYLEYRVMYVAV